jgi:hypothetical protein
VFPNAPAVPVASEERAYPSPVLLRDLAAGTVGRRWETRATIEPNRETWRESLEDDADKGSFQSSNYGYEHFDWDIQDHALPRDDAVTAVVGASANDLEETAQGRCRAAALVVVVVLLDDATEAPFWAFRGYALALE